MITLLVEQLYVASTGKTHFLATNFFKIYSKYSNCLGVLHALERHLLSFEVWVEHENKGSKWRLQHPVYNITNHVHCHGLLLFCFVVLCYDVPEVGHGRSGPQGGKEDNQDNVGNKEEVDNEEADKEEKVDIMGRRRRMRRCLQDH